MWFWFTATRGRNKQWFWVGSKHMIMQWQQQRVDKKVREDLPLHMNPQWINEWLYGFVMVLTLLHITPHLIFLCYVGSFMHYNKKFIFKINSLSWFIMVIIIMKIQLLNTKNCSKFMYKNLKLRQIALSSYFQNVWRYTVMF